LITYVYIYMELIFIHENSFHISSILTFIFISQFLQLTDHCKIEKENLKRSPSLDPTTPQKDVQAASRYMQAVLNT
jgi:hypothetical protein